MNLLLVSHLGLASGMVKAAQFITESQDEIYYVELDERGINLFKTRLAEMLDSFDKDEELVLVSDIPAGSPGNTGLEMLLKSNFDFQYFSGMNLGMILEITLSGSPENAVLAGTASIRGQTDKPESSDEDF
ncbi:PTS sugar transporter subunit IIA [Dellaglioa algida]|uniref:PTS sugar transporter subunit IIA n=1 Tax=Dellaglioa algida TaxID=105612 RepID=UPI0024C4B15E|nr:hypothetical protein [Dellaglioa algida]MDK1728459.1 hypothetical protein [Dellaglioa algida]MDK1736137.1 hypothetical protein [Dellaglioa algida]MDK1737824.1 hypothetical protein [Dellaglioa algida]